MVTAEGLRPRIKEETHDEQLLNEMMRHYPLVIARTALSVSMLINSKVFRNNLWQRQIEERKRLIDKRAADTMIECLGQIPFQTKKVGSEGDKEILYAGMAAASAKGQFGKNGYPRLWGVSDVVDGTSFAVRNQPGAVSAIAITEEGGIMPTPIGVNHMVKLIGPPQANGIMSLDQDHRSNLRRLIETLGIKPQELTQVTLDPKKKGREINQKYIDAAQEIGINIDIISGGDLVPSIRAAMVPDKYRFGYMVVVGRGGFEEGTIAAAAVKALGGFMEAKAFDENPEKMTKNPLLTLNELVPSREKLILVSLGFITDDTRFGKSGVIRNANGSHSIATANITHKEINFQPINISNHKY